MHSRSRNVKRRRALLAMLLIVCALAAIGVVLGALWLRTPVGRAAANVALYRARVLWLRWFGDGSPSGAGAMAGLVRDAAGQPLPGALVLVSTVQGTVYSTTSDDLGTGQCVHHGRGSDARDGTWHEVVRNLAADLEDSQPGNTITAVNGIYIRGSGMVDVIKLLAERPD